MSDDLLAILKQARSGMDTELERRLIAVLADSEVVVPVGRDEDGGLGLRVSINPDGSRHLLAFTSREELERWADEADIEASVMRGRELAAASAQTGAVALWIDPVSEHGGRLSRELVDLVAAHGMLEVRDGADGVLRLETGERPLQVRALDIALREDGAVGLRETVRSIPSVTGAWLFGGAGPGAADVVLLLADSAPEPAPEILRAFSAALPPGRSGDVYPITPAEAASEDFAASIARGVSLLG